MPLPVAGYTRPQRRIRLAADRGGTKPFKASRWIVAVPMSPRFVFPDPGTAIAVVGAAVELASGGETEDSVTARRGFSHRPIAVRRWKSILKDRWDFGPDPNRSEVNVSEFRCGALHDTIVRRDWPIGSQYGVGYEGSPDDRWSRRRRAARVIFAEKSLFRLDACVGTCGSGEPSPRCVQQPHRI